ncbi:family 16 glycosylhydrolase [Dankookia sp. GCM10030260]
MAILNARSVALTPSGKVVNWLTPAAKGGSLAGTAGADMLSAPNGPATLAGGAGDDTYAIWSADVTLRELAGGGIDTVQSYAAAFVLPDFIENLQLMWTGTAGRGNALANIITGADGAQTLDGGAGDDVLSGGAGADTFVVRRGNGSEVITDFQPGTDRILLQDHALHSFATLQPALRQTGADTVLTLGNESLVLRNTQAATLSARDFQLPADPTHAGMRVTFNEDFNSLSASANGRGTTWKTTLKIVDQLRTLTTNGEAQYYSDASVGVNPFKVSGGILDITAAPGSNPLKLAYNSGALTTAQSFAQQYGFFEVRADLPSGQGFWPAFWLLPTDGSWPPEIDIFEVLGQDPTTAYFSLHTTTGPTTTAKVSLLPDLSAGFHTYGLDWQADRIRWYVDGNQVAEAATPADMHRPMYMLLNLAVGDAGSWPGKYDPGMPTGHLLVDYVRVWQNGATQPPPVDRTVRGPADVAAAGGSYSLRPDGVSDLYDFGKARSGIQLDASGLSAQLAHTVWGSAHADHVTAGAGTLNLSAGAGDDTFVFGPGTSRVMGGAGNDTFVLRKGAIATGDQIIDFQRSLPGGGEHDLLRLEGFSAAAQLNHKGGSGAVQYYTVTDGGYVSPVITLTVTNATTPLTQADYAFTG